jgi:uncharacterized protein with WD repeat
MMTPQLRRAGNNHHRHVNFKPERKILIMPDDEKQRDPEQEGSENSDEAEDAAEKLEPRPPQRSGKTGG